MTNLLEVKNLKVHFDTEDGVARSVDGISYSLERGKTLGIVGESGCGKSVSSLAILQLVPDPPGRVPGGQILFKGKDLLKFSDPAIRKIRGDRSDRRDSSPL